jgi:hypothetical protein
MTPELYTAIKDVLNYSRADTTHGDSGYLGFMGGINQCHRLKLLEKEFALHDPQRQVLVDTWVRLRDATLVSQDERFAFLPATSMVQVSRNSDREGFVEVIMKHTLPSLVDDLESKHVISSDVYAKTHMEFTQLQEAERAQVYLTTTMKDIFPKLKRLWAGLGTNLAVDHLYIMVDSNNENNVAWHVVAVTRKLTAASVPYEHNATLVSTPEIRDTGGISTELTPADILRGGVHISGIQDFTSLSPETLLGTIVSGISDPDTRVSTVVKAVVAAMSPGIPLAALRDTKLLIVYEPHLSRFNVCESTLANIANKKARILYSDAYCKETAQFVLSDTAGVLAVVLGAPGFDIQQRYIKETMGKQGVHHIHQLVLLIKSGKTNEWALAATLSEGVES